MTCSEAAAALRRGREIEQFVALSDGQITYLVVSPRTTGFQLTRHVVRDEGAEDFRDISEFSPVDEDESVGEGVVVAEFDDAREAASAAAQSGGSDSAWVDSGLAADDYWTAKTAAASTVRQ